MPISVRFLSGSMEGREFHIAKDAIRVGDDEQADVRIDPNERDNGGARNRVIEVYRESDGFRLHSTGAREVSAQGETSIDRKVQAGDEIRFGAWGPIFTVLGAPGRPADRTAPISVPVAPPAAEDSAARRKKLETTGGYRTASGEKPVGPKTVYMMIQDALGKAREGEGFLDKSTTFMREVVTDSVRNATRSFKIGLGLMGAAILVLAALLVYNISSTSRTLTEVSRAADRRVSDTKAELTGEIETLKQGREAMAKESSDLTQRLQTLESTKDADQKAITALRQRLRESDERRAALEDRMSRALAALEADRKQLAAEKERLERERQLEAERRRAEEAENARRAAEAAAAAQPPPVEPVATPVP